MGAMVGKVQIVQASMFVRKVKLMPSVFLAHAKTLERNPAKYPIRRDSSELSRCQSRETFFRSTAHAHRDRTGRQSRLQRRSAEYHFNFQHFNLNEIAVYLDGQQQHAVRPVTDSI